MWTIQKLLAPNEHKEIMSLDQTIVFLKEEKYSWRTWSSVEKEAKCFVLKKSYTFCLCLKTAPREDDLLLLKVPLLERNNSFFSMERQCCICYVDLQTFVRNQKDMTKEKHNVNHQPQVRLNIWQKVWEIFENIIPPTSSDCLSVDLRAFVPYI